LVELNDEAKVRDTILHEIAHAMVGRLHGHDFKWKHTAQQIGCTGERCFDHTKVLQPHKPWVAICEVCGKEYRSYRMHRSKCACRMCYNEHKDKAILTFKYIKEERK
jgi:predicted SprT family Zn-dependent metalloprotease